MKIVMLIVACDSTPIHVEYQKLWRKYMNTYKDIKSFFIKSKDDLTSEIQEDEDTIYVKGNECLIPGVLHKTLKSVEYIIKKYEFDYLYRTNLSSFICLEKLYTFVSNNKLDYGGMLYHYDEHGGFPAHLKKEYKFSYASGSGFFMSNEACRNLIIMKNTLDMDIIDDVEIVSCLTKKYTILNIESNDSRQMPRALWYLGLEECESKNFPLATALLHTSYKLGYDDMEALNDFAHKAKKLYDYICSSSDQMQVTLDEAVDDLACYYGVLKPSNSAVIQGAKPLEVVKQHNAIDTEKLDTTNCFHYILTSPESMTVMVTQHLESDIQKELGFLSIPYIKKINFLTKLLEDKEVKDREFFQKSLTNVRKESFCTCYDHFKNQIDSRIETPNIDVDNEEEYTKELSNIMGLLFKIKMV